MISSSFFFLPLLVLVLLVLLPRLLPLPPCPAPRPHFPALPLASFSSVFFIRSSLFIVVPSDLLLSLTFSVSDHKSARLSSSLLGVLHLHAQLVSCQLSQVLCSSSFITCCNLFCWLTCLVMSSSSAISSHYCCLLCSGNDSRQTSSVHSLPLLMSSSNSGAGEKELVGRRSKEGLPNSSIIYCRQGEGRDVTTTRRSSRRRRGKRRMSTTKKRRERRRRKVMLFQLQPILQDRQAHPTSMDRYPSTR